jgi:5-methylcytosine-specific restriction endonuclease McrA
MGLPTLRPRIGMVDLRTAALPPKVANPFYSSAAWLNLVAKLKAERGAKCQVATCGRTGVRIFGDHIKELQDGGEALDPLNVMLMCGSCHTRKTAAVRVKRATSAVHRVRRGESDQLS